MNKIGYIVKELISFILMAAVIFLVVKVVYAKIVEPIKVEGSSMEYTLQDGNRLFMFKQMDLDRFDVIVFPNPKSLARKEAMEASDPQAAKKMEVKLNIKRIIGLPGDHIAFQDGQLLLNGQVYTEPYLEKKVVEYSGQGENLSRGHFTRDFDMTDLTNQQVVPAGKLFVMGDNRRNSTDSRSYGFVDIDTVLGEANVVFWPLNRLGRLTSYTFSEDGTEIVRE